ncbi:MAG TPA: YIP1 family protein [Mariprofundaceae bacterium]|nr:YIP1 family protein [Mariprofundaceae bacterium]
MIYFNINRMTETLIPACKAVIMEPRATFEQMPKTGFYRDGFGLLSLIILAAAAISVPFIGFVLIFLLPFIWGTLLICYRLWASYLSWAVRTFGQQKLNPINAFQLSAYAAVPMVLGFVPVLGIVASLWNLYLLWLALVANVKVKESTALVIIAVPTLVLTVSLVLFADLLLKLLPQLGSMLNP